MTYAKDLQIALRRWLGDDKVVFMKGWSGAHRNIGWAAPRRKPVALLCHHTAGARTDSVDPNHPGNLKGANDGIIRFVDRHPEFGIPAANFTLDRDGTVYVHAAYPVYHAGKGAFLFWPFRSLGIPRDRGNDFMLGVEVVDQGLRRSFTQAQKDALGALANACADASDWGGLVKRLPNHKTWAPDRKVDTKYPLSWIMKWAVQARSRGPVKP